MRRSTVAALVAALWLSPTPAAGQAGLPGSLTTILDTSVNTITSTTTTIDGTTTKARVTTLTPRLTVSAQAMIYENLRLALGGVFDADRSSADLDGIDTSSRQTRLRPYVELRSMNAMFAPGLGYYRRESRSKATGGGETLLVNDDYAAYLGLRPSGLPQVDIQVLRADTYDAERAGQDVTRNTATLLSRYTHKDVNLTYQGTYLGSSDRLRHFESRQFSHAIRVDSARSFMAGRLLWNGMYNADRQSLTTVSSGEDAELALPVVAFAGLALASDTPVTAALLPSPGLIDGNLQAGAGVNLGLPALGADTQARNVGLDFAAATEVNRILVWIDRELPSAISGTFSWDVYSSVDNLTWTRETVVANAVFGPFENRFRLDFRTVSARYVKVVTRPLSGVVLDAARYPEILVTEVQAYQTQPSGSGRNRLSRTGQNLTSDVRYRLLQSPLLHYEGSLWVLRVPSGQHRHTVSNGLSAAHRLTRTVSSSGRLSYEWGTDRGKRRTATLANGTLTFDPLRAFTGSLLYTGQRERIGGSPNDRQSLTARVNTQLYRGVDVQAGLGWAFSTRETGEHQRDRLVNLNAFIVPRPDLTVTANYSDTTTTRSGTFVGRPDYHTRSGFLTVAYDPIRTLRMVLAEELIAITGERTRTTHNVGIDWAPFRDGALQFRVAYNEAVRPLEFGTERVFQTGLRLSLSRQSYVDVTYQRIESAFTVQKTKSKVLSVNVKIFL